MMATRWFADGTGTAGDQPGGSIEKRTVAAKPENRHMASIQENG